MKRRKKHKFLRFLLTVIIAVLVFVGVRSIFDFWAYKELAKVCVDYPFVYHSQSDANWYVTEDFNVPTSYVHNDKEYLVEWKSYNENLIRFDAEGNATVTRPEGSAEKVVVSQVYKKLLGKAEIEYELNVVACPTLDSNTVKVVTVDSLKDNSYNRDMRAVFDESDRLEYMIGDFKDTLIYSGEDATAVAMAYREQFDFPKTHEIVLNRVVSTASLINYIYDVQYDGYKVQGAGVNITVDSDTYQMKKIDMNAGAPVCDFKEDDDLDFDTLIKAYVSEHDTLNSGHAMVIIKENTFIENGRLVNSFRIIYDHGEFYKIYIDANTGEVSRYFKNENTLFEREATTSKGVTERGEHVKVDTSKTPLGVVEMYDVQRGIHTYDNKGWFELFNSTMKKKNGGDDAGLLASIGALVNYYVANEMNFEIKAKDGFIDNSVAVQSHYYLENAYDWYKDTFGLMSFDGKGSPIVVLTDIGIGTDNASWVVDEQVFRVLPAEKLVLSVSSGAEVMAHEYTHAVFGSKLAGTFDNASPELGGLNEGYADLFGCLASGSTDWIVGLNVLSEINETVCIRDIGNINRDDEQLQDIKLLGDLKYPEKYKGDNWDGESHRISVLISHVAYEMCKSGLFSEDEVAHIWYDSLGYGYTADSTFLTAREYVLAAADINNCTREQITFIEKAFSDVGIGTFENVLETQSSSVEGDLLYDDSTQEKYLIIYSLFGNIFGDSGIYVFQSGTGATKEEMQETSGRLTSLVRNKFTESSFDGINEILSLFENTPGEFSLSREDLFVEYKQISEVHMDGLSKVCESAQQHIRELMDEGIGLVESETGTELGPWLDMILKLGFYWEVKEGTAYEVFDSYGLIQ